MRSILVSVCSSLLLVPICHAQANAHIEDALVYIQVSAQTTDQSTGMQRTVKIGEGSGFLIHRSGWVVTAAHVINIKPPADGKLILRGHIRSRESNDVYRLEIPPGAIVTSDVALLRFPAGLGIKLPYLCVERHPRLEVRQSIVAAGYPLGQDFSVRSGTITSLSGKNSTIQGQLGLARGMSGGPVVDVSKNSVIGVIHGGIEGQASFDYFTPVNLALPIFETPPASFVGETFGGETCAPTGPTSTANAAVTVERSYEISETNDDHPDLFFDTTKKYKITKKADPGYIIIGARLDRTSDTRVSDLTIDISPDRQSVDLNFSLTAGPKADRYRGWLKGNMILTMQEKT